MAIIAFILIGNAFNGIINKIPGRQTYYFIPEANLLIKRAGNTLRFSESLKILTNDSFYDTDFLIKKDNFNSTIYYPLEQHRYGRMYLQDPNNCLICLRSRRTIVWLAEQTNDADIPQCLEIELPIKKGILQYRTVDGSNHQAIKLKKKDLNTVMVDSSQSIVDINLKDILSPFSVNGSIEDSDIHVERTPLNTFVLHIRNNYIECKEVYYDYYPRFYYNPNFPNCIICIYERSIVSKRCEDISLITPSYLEPFIRFGENNNWYVISLDPFKISEVKPFQSQNCD